MKIKLIATAVAGVFGFQAAASFAQSTVQLYGTIDLEYGYLDQGIGTNGPRPSVDMMQVPLSNIGFKGEEKLGGGLSAWFQCESTADIRGVNQDGFCGRNSAVGLKGPVGNIFMGRWDTPFKRTMLPTSFVGANVVGLWGSTFLLTAGSTSTLDGSSRALFQRRQSNTINYDSPVWNGFQVLAAVSSTNGATSATVAATAAKPRLWSLGAQYTSGLLYISGAYEKHSQFGAIGGANDDTGWHLGAAYTLMGKMKVAAFYTQQNLETSATTESKINAWQLGMDWNITGPHSLLASYTATGDVKGNSLIALAGSGATRPAALNLVNGVLVSGDTGAELWTLRYRYQFSKRTQTFGGYARLNNDARAAYTLGGLSGASSGNKQDGWGVGLRHNF